MVWHRSKLVSKRSSNIVTVTLELTCIVLIQPVTLGYFTKHHQFSVKYMLSIPTEKLLNSNEYVKPPADQSIGFKS